jgi:hypothetical protein
VIERTDRLGKKVSIPQSVHPAEAKPGGSGEGGVSIMAQDGTAGVAKVISLGGAGTPETPDQSLINDHGFIKDLNALKELRSFVIREAVNVEDPTALSFGRLDLLRYDANGVAPTQEDWSEVELHKRTLFSLLTEPLRRKFLLGEIPMWLAALPVAFAAVALLALYGAVHAATNPAAFMGKSILPFYLVWVVLLGAIGSIAFIGMNALSIQRDITFDLTSRTLILLRIVLGALFGLVLTLPFGFPAFIQFIARMMGWPWDENWQKAWGATASDTKLALLLVLPFVLGFSTSLVIVVLNRLVDSAQAFFGRSGTSESSQKA